MTEDDGLRDSLRLAAKAADREQAAETLRPAFEKRLKELGYGPGAITQAFSTLTGPGTVAEALAELAQTAWWERGRAVALEFEIVEREPALPSGHLLTITGVERDGHGIQIRYTVEPRLPEQAGVPRAEGRDDRGNAYQDIGGLAGIAGPADRTTGALTMPYPQPRAEWLLVRMSFSQDDGSLWGRPAYELRITLDVRRAQNEEAIAGERLDGSQGPAKDHPGAAGR
jgi:hypothetical protein